MVSNIDIEAIRAAIVSEMEARGLSRRKLSAAAGIGETAIRDLLERTANPGIATLNKVAGALDVPVEKLIGAHQVPLVGQIGAGGRIAYQSDVEHYEMVARPPNAVGNVIAYEVLGDSMLPKYEAGDVIYIDQDGVESPSRHVGEYCAVRLADGGTYLKVLATGRDNGLYTLRSLNAADIEDVEVEWATPVLFIMPRRSR